MKRPPFGLFLLLAAYIFAAIWRLPLTRGQLNPDGISYLSIAHRYLAGDFSGALNGHWGPLFSWLLMPLLAVGIEPLLACKIETITTGFGTLLGAWLLSSRYTTIVSVRLATCAALVPIVLHWATSLISPDLLVVCLLTSYAYFISDPAPSSRSIVWAALFGALTYLAKSYGFVFFLAHFSLLTAVRWWCAEGKERGVVCRHWLIGLAFFCVLSLPWALALSVKYGRPTFGTAAAYNFGLVGPANAEIGAQKHPMESAGLLEPPDEGAVSAWDDPSSLHFPPWPLLGQSVAYLSSLFRHNCALLFDTLQAASPLAWVLVVLPLVIPFLPSFSRRARLLVATVASAALYAAGYLPLLVESRYIWILVVLLLMLAAGLMDLLAQRFQFARLKAGLLALAISLSFMVAPLRSFPVSGELETQAAKIASALAAQGIDLRGRRIASDDQWAKSLYVTYFVHAHYYGTILPGVPAEIRQQLDQHRIDTFLVLRHQIAPPAYLEGFRPTLTQTEGARFALYQREL